MPSLSNGFVVQGLLVRILKLVLDDGVTIFGALELQVPAYVFVYLTLCF